MCGYWQNIGNVTAATDVFGKERGTVSFCIFRADQLFAKISAYLKETSSHLIYYE